MPMPAPVCPKCHTTMDEGFAMDATYGATLQSTWAEGKPKVSFWSGILVKKSDRHPITTYRCPTCGYLESYAVME